MRPDFGLPYTFGRSRKKHKLFRLRYPALEKTRGSPPPLNMQSLKFQEFGSDSRDFVLRVRSDRFCLPMRLPSSLKIE